MIELKFIAALIILVGLKICLPTKKGLKIYLRIYPFRQMSVEQCPIICFTAATSYVIEFFSFFFFGCVELMVFISVSVYIFHTTTSILHNNIDLIL